MNKRGLSQVITTILLILLIILALAGIWAAIDNFVLRTSTGLTFEKFSIDLKIKSIDINASESLLSVGIQRNPGEGELRTVKIIVSDSKNSYVFERGASDLQELAFRTYDLNLSEAEFLDKNDIQSVSITPTFLSDSGSVVFGRELDSVEGGLAGKFLKGEDEILNGDDDEEEDLPECFKDSDCPEPRWKGDLTCKGDNALKQTYVEYICDRNFCRSIVDDEKVKIVCQQDEYCDYAQSKCVPNEDRDECTQKTVSSCGVDGWTGQAKCAADGKTVIQNYLTNICNVDNRCDTEIEEDKFKETCEGEEVCKDGVCFEYKECSSRLDPVCLEKDMICNLSESECVPEVVVASGEVGSVWPYNVGEYMDGTELIIDEQKDLAGYHIIFPGSLETRCLSIGSSVYKKVGDRDVSYLKLVGIPTNVSVGDSYEIWESQNVCKRVEE